VIYYFICSYSHLL